MAVAKEGVQEPVLDESLDLNGYVEALEGLYKETRFGADDKGIGRNVHGRVFLEGERQTDDAEIGVFDGFGELDQRFFVGVANAFPRILNLLKTYKGLVADPSNLPVPSADALKEPPVDNAAIVQELEQTRALLKSSDIIVVEKDGPSFFAHWGNYEPPESPAGFGDTVEQAVVNLLEEDGVLLKSEKDLSTEKFQTQATPENVIIIDSDADEFIAYFGTYDEDSEDDAKGNEVGDGKTKGEAVVALLQRSGDLEVFETAIGNVVEPVNKEPEAGNDTPPADSGTEEKPKEPEAKETKASKSTKK